MNSDANESRPAVAANGGLRRTLRRWAKLPLRMMLRTEPVRRRIVFDLRQEYYHELHCNVPLGCGLVCPIYHWEAWASFAHIFFEHEYTRAFEKMPLPRRWIDIGCYAGFFSLYTVWQRAQQGLSPDFEALLIDGDSRSAEAVSRLAALNRLEDRLRFKHGLIAREQGERAFVERAFQTSSLAKNGETDGVVRRVQTIAPAEILSLLPPPYDLIKIDIEGGEYEFLAAYPEVLRQTRYLLMEWHSWHPGGGDLPQLQQMLAGQGFELTQEVLKPEEAVHRHGDRRSGVLLYARR